MRNKLNLFLIMLIASQITPTLAETSPQELSITVQGDGVTRLDYLFQAEITSLQTNITLLGENYEDLFIVNVWNVSSDPICFQRDFIRRNVMA